MPASPAGTIVSTLRDGNGVVVLEVTVRYNPATLAMLGVDVVNSTGRTQNVEAVKASGATVLLPVPPGSTTITSGQLSGAGVGTYTLFGALSLKVI